MELKEIKKLTASCGIDCFNCEVYEKNITPEFQQHLASVFGKNPEDISCQGCRVSGCILTNGKCATKDCASDKNLDFCYECQSFPCQNLMPVSDGAEKYPHNFKLYNLCRMKKIGLEDWAKEALENRTKYFKGKFKIGVGPVLD